MNEKILGRIHRCFSPLYLLAGFLLIWQIVPSIGLTDSHYFPPLSIVLAELTEIGVGELLTHTLTSLRRVLVGFVLASATALPLGFVLAGALPRLARLLNPLMTFLAQIPAFILFPVFVVIFGTGEVSIHFVIYWSCVWPILFATITGTGLIDPLLIKCARSMRADGVAIFLDIIVPGALPGILVGMRTGLTLCFMMLIGAETMGAKAGLGWQLNMAKRMALVPRIFFLVLVIALVGLLVNLLFECLEKKTVIRRSDRSEEAKNNEIA